MHRFHHFFWKIRIASCLLAGLVWLTTSSESVFGQANASPEMELVASPTRVASTDLMPMVTDSMPACQSDRIFWVSTRHLATEACRANVQSPNLRMWELECGRFNPTTTDAFHATLSVDRPVVIYVHGNRMTTQNLVERSAQVRSAIRRCCDRTGIDWVIFSWPSDRNFAGLRDFRQKADQCDAQGLYLATFLHPITASGIPTGMIGFSFGARVITGSLHALAGGRLAGRQVQNLPITGANVKVGLVAPAIESTWLMSGDYHGQATENMERLLLLYNRRDAVLKRYWLIERVRRQTALGFSGPSCFGPRIDGSRLPVRSRDCSPTVKLRHVELDYYTTRCNAGSDMAGLIRELGTVRDQPVLMTR